MIKEMNLKRWKNYRVGEYFDVLGKIVKETLTNEIVLNMKAWLLGGIYEQITWKICLSGSTYIWSRERDSCSIIERQSSTALKRGIRKHLKQIDKHKEHLQNHSEYIKEWEDYDERFREGLKRHWQKEIHNFEQSINDKMEELRKRGEKYEW